jgi:hypothetical protein
MQQRAFVMALQVIAVSFGVKFSAELDGRWRLDGSRSNGVGPGVELTVDITRNGDILYLESRIRVPQGPVVLNDTIQLVNRAVPYTYKRPNGQEGRGLRTAGWLSGATGISISDSVLLDTPIGPMPRWTTQRWTLDSAGTTLTQQITVRQPFVSIPVTNVFVRERR